jgi:hypothetical protein
MHCRQKINDKPEFDIAKAHIDGTKTTSHKSNSKQILLHVYRRLIIQISVLNLNICKLSNYFRIIALHFAGESYTHKSIESLL